MEQHFGFQNIKLSKYLNLPPFNLYQKLTIWLVFCFFESGRFTRWQVGSVVSHLTHEVTTWHKIWRQDARGDTRPICWSSTNHQSSESKLLLFYYCNLRNWAKKCCNILTASWQRNEIHLQIHLKAWCHLQIHSLHVLRSSSSERLFWFLIALVMRDHLSAMGQFEHIIFLLIVIFISIWKRMLLLELKVTFTITIVNEIIGSSFLLNLHPCSLWAITIALMVMRVMMQIFKYFVSCLDLRHQLMMMVDVPEDLRNLDPIRS